jgi:hypothetical protein
VARATVFLSHAWSYVFADLMTAVAAHFDGDAQAGSVYVWNGAHAPAGAPRRAQA